MNDSGPINPKLATLWHGGDYNPDQWPEEAVRRDDVRLMNLAGVNVASVAIFAWAALEPRPGEYDWSWLDETFERLHKGGVFVALATPTAAHPRWLTAMHPEIMAVNSHRVRLPHGARMRFCPTSPVFREHAARIDRALAERYGRHPALVLWHVSNEYSPGCHCDLCAEAFRDWLRRRYGSLETLNHEYWSAFWSHTFGDWSEVIPPYADCGTVPNALVLDWKRFLSHQVCDFFKHEATVLREVTPDVPITTNMMGWHPYLNYTEYADVMDVVSWDAYPDVGGDPAEVASGHVLMRCMKENRPWIFMEQTPSATNWKDNQMLQPPGLLRLRSWQAVGHGSDSVMYFQWRRSRGGHEKFHGAVVAHVGDERPRVFHEVADLGAELAKVGPRVVGTRADAARVAILWDKESRWALEGSCGPGHDKRVPETAWKHFKAVWRENLLVDVIRAESDWSPYSLIIAPVFYMVRSGRYPLDASPEELRARVDVAGKIEKWVKAGGTFVSTYLSGIVNESDLVYEGGYPGPLRKLLGIWVEETDVTAPGKMVNQIVLAQGAAKQNAPTGGMRARYACDRYFDLVQTEGARVLATYGKNWYKGRPCLTVNKVGKGRAYHIAADAEDAFLADFYKRLASEQGIEPVLPPVEGVEVIERTGGGRRLVFVLNHTAKRREVRLGKVKGKDLLSGKTLKGRVGLEPLGVRIIECA